MPTLARPLRPVALVSLLALAACGSPNGSADPNDAGGLGTGTPDASVTNDQPDAGTEPDAGSETPDAGTSETPDAGTETPDAGPPPEPVTRFVALGDTGTATQKQYAVASAVLSVCTARGGCDFGLLLGDNFYDTGVKDANDDLFRTMFEIPYGPLGFPIHPTLGNHDYGGEGLGWELTKGQHYLDYAARNPQWVMPALHYAFDEGPVTLLNLDTTAIFWGLDSEQRGALPGRIAASTKPWKIAYGHHPYISNGDHGNAGEYDGVPSWIPIASGKNVKEFVEDELCGKVDVYLCGHDHSMQDLGSKCGTEFLVSGAGAKTTTIDGDTDGRGSPNATHWNGKKANGDLYVGFVLVEATAHTLTFTFFDETGTELHGRTISK